MCEARNYRESARIRRTGATGSPARNDREAMPGAPSADDGFEVWVSEERAGQGGLREEAAHTGDWPKG